MEFVGPVSEVTIDCEHILRTLPDWFGIEESLNEYVADTQRFPTFVVKESEQVVGFITARQHFESAWEIHCLAVERAKRGTGVGRLLVKGLEEWLHTKQAKYIQVKTIAENHPSAEYAETRAFYNKMGYEPLEVFTEIWGTANPCLQLIKRLPGANVLARPCDYARDIERVIALLLNYRTAASLHDTYPHPWRLRLLLSSRVWDAVQDSRIWEDANGRPAAFAMLWRRRPTSPYLALERFVDPASVTDELVAATWQWATERAQAIAQELGEPLTMYAARLATAVYPNDQLEAYGFTPRLPDPDAQGVYFARPLAGDIPTPALPPGYLIRPLQSTAELAAYEELYDFTAVHPHHRQETFNSDEYGHLVAVADTGQFVAYCEYAFCRAEWAQSGRRRGWIEYLGVRPEKRRQGLGRAALLAGLRQLQAAGVETALLGTMSSSQSAVKLYETTGFTRLATVETTAYEKIENKSINPA
jgi:ribosomal protein S18 acetylase RimI-like enzyme